MRERSSNYFYTVPQKKFNIQSVDCFMNYEFLKDFKLKLYELQFESGFAFLMMQGILQQPHDPSPRSVQSYDYHVIPHMIHREGRKTEKMKLLVVVVVSVLFSVVSSGPLFKTCGE